MKIRSKGGLNRECQLEWRCTSRGDTASRLCECVGGMGEGRRKAGEERVCIHMDLCICMNEYVRGSNKNKLDIFYQLVLELFLHY